LLVDVNLLRVNHRWFAHRRSRCDRESVILLILLPCWPVTLRWGGQPRKEEEGMGTIAKLSRQGAARVESLPGFEGRYVEGDGYVLGFESFDQAADFTPMYRGLPDDLCQSHHWGYVIEGRMIFHRPEGDEVFEKGDAYYVGPGHTGEVGLAGTQVVEFSPSDEYARTMAVVAKNLQGLGS
jgi:hypothetical protein